MNMLYPVRKRSARMLITLLEPRREEISPYAYPNLGCQFVEENEVSLFVFRCLGAGKSIQGVDNANTIPDCFSLSSLFHCSNFHAS
jgi:hypothetical protein